MPISEQTYRQVALEDPEGLWELVCGRLRSKPAMTTEHNATSRMLVHLLNAQLDVREYAVSMEGPPAARVGRLLLPARRLRPSTEVRAASAGEARQL